MDQVTFERKLNNRLSKFSSHLMSNSKWVKLFDVLSQNVSLFEKVYIDDVWEETGGYDRVFSDDFNDLSSLIYEKGIKDVLIGGPLLFKEIKEFKIYSTQLNELNEVINSIGKFEMHAEENCLVIYGYM